MLHAPPLSLPFPDISLLISKILHVCMLSMPPYFGGISLSGNSVSTPSGSYHTTPSNSPSRRSPLSPSLINDQIFTHLLQGFASTKSKWKRISIFSAFLCCYLCSSLLAISLALRMDGWVQNRVSVMDQKRRKLAMDKILGQKHPCLEGGSK